MNHSPDADWHRLVQKTRKRPLMWFPDVVQSKAGMTVRSKLSDRLQLIALTTVMGVIFTRVSFLIPEFIIMAFLFVCGSFCLYVAFLRSFFSASIFIPANVDEVIIRYGFILLQTRLVLDRQSVVVDYYLGSETRLSRSWRGFKIVSLRHLETQEDAYIGYTMKSDDALRVFNSLSRILAEGSRNYTQAVITLEDDSILRVDRLATWEAGKWRNYRSQLTVVAPNTVEIERKAFGTNRNVVDRAADVYPVRIESNDESVRLIYSNHDEKSVLHDDCVALQLCKEKIAQRATRYEVNLIVNSFQDNRLNLISFDLRRHESPDEPRRAAEQLGEFLDIEVLDHL